MGLLARHEDRIMPYDMRLPKRLRKLWRVKIQDREALYEEPHVTIWRKDQKWRYSLRRRIFLDPQPDPALVPGEILETDRPAVR